MTFILISFIAGLLTVLAPCVLPLLPVIIGGSVTDNKEDERRRKLKPYIITGSLALSVLVFTLLLKATTAFIDIPQGFWTGFSGTILILFALTMLFPRVWARLLSSFKADHTSNVWLAKATQKKGFVGDVLIGAALGPVFSSCSPTYAVIVVTVLPQSFFIGLLNLIAYVIGLMVILLAIALLGQKFVGKISVLSDPDGWFKKTIGVLFLVVAIAVITGVDKKFENYLISKGLVAPIDIEHNLLERVEVE